MEKFQGKQIKIGAVDEKWQRRSGNMKKVAHPVLGNVDVCPYPPSHFSDLSAEAEAIKNAKNELSLKTSNSRS